jgi:hypothetical protein
MIPFIARWLLPILLIQKIGALQPCVNTDGTKINAILPCQCSNTICETNVLANENICVIDTNHKGTCTHAKHAHMYVEVSGGQSCRQSKQLSTLQSASECKAIALQRGWENAFFVRSPQSVDEIVKPPGCYTESRNVYYNRNLLSNITCDGNNGKRSASSGEMKCMCRTSCKPGEYGVFDTSIYEKHLKRNKLSCKKCSKSYYSNEYGTSYCKKCDSNCLPGTYFKYAGASTCKCSACPYGKYQNSINQHQCINCQKGKYNDEMQSTHEKSCQSCQIGQYSMSAHGAKACVQCPLHTTTLSKGTDHKKKCLRCSNNNKTNYPQFSSVGNVHHIRSDQRCNMNVESYCDQTRWSYINNSIDGNDGGGCIKHYNGACTRKICPYSNQYHPDSLNLFKHRYDSFPITSCSFFNNITEQEKMSQGGYVTAYTGCYDCLRGNGIDKKYCNYGYCSKSGYSVRTGCQDCLQGW